MSNWTLFSNHGHVLVCLARDPEARLRDVAADVGITERAVQKIVRDLQDGGMISITKAGRRNCYRIHKKQSLRHKLEAACNLQDLIRLVNRESGMEHPDMAVAHKFGPEVKTTPGPGESKLASRLDSEPEPAASKPAPVKPEAAEPKAIEPKAVEPKAIEPKAIEPKTVKSNTDKPAVEKEVETGEPKPSSNLEKQQGSLF